MEVRDWMMILSALIVASGWFVTGYLNRLKDIAQKRTQYRLEALEAFLPVWFTIQKDASAFSKPDFLSQLEVARAKFQLYGSNDEINIMEKFIESIEEKDVPGANEALGELVPLVRKKIRKELRINA